MNDVLAFLQARRSVAAKSLAAPAPAPEQLDAILTVASRVPDHGRLVPWRFVVIEGEGRQRLGDRLADWFRADQPEAEESLVERERQKPLRAPLIVAVVSRARPHVKIPVWEQELTAGAVCMNLVHAASAMGFGSVWLSDWFAFDRRVLDLLGLDPDERVAGYIYIGTPSERLADRPRPALADLVARF